MEQVKITTPRLFLTSSVENKDEIEEKLERSYGFLQNLITGLGDKEAHDVLNNSVCKDKNYEEVSIGLLVSILSDPNNAPKSYRDLTLITRDGFGLVLTNLNQIVLERYLRLNDIPRSQLLWLLREMIRNGVTNVDNLCWNILRHAAGGDVSQKNINLIESLLDIFQEHRSWLDKYPLLIASVVYTYLRLVEDHNLPYLLTLRQKEVNFLIALIRERFHDCIGIGRDFVRLLQNVARIPEFEQLWKDILLNPKSLAQNFSGVLQLLQARTSRRFLQSRLTPDMERKLAFLTSQVRFGNHKRYQDWFQRQYLSTPESQSLRCDMIRFIVGVIHPTNELLCSDIIPRWAVIGWLLTTCTSSVAVSNSKLALFYDWLFYDSEKDNIMNIEPAILVMHHSMRSHPAVSATLLDFLCRIITNFYPPLTEKVRSGIFCSLRQILEKRVLPSLQPLFDNAKLDRELRSMVRDTFKEFCVNQLTVEPSSKLEDFGSNHGHKNDDMDTNDQRINCAVINNHNNDSEAVFSDEEEEPPLIIHTEDDTDDDDIPLAKVRLKEKVLPEKGDSNIIEGTLRVALTRLQSEKEKLRQCQAMESIVQQVLDLDLEVDILTALAKCLCTATQDDVKPEVFPTNFNSADDSLNESISSAFFILFKNLYKLCKQEDKRRHQLITLIAEMYGHQANVGYLLLYFLKVMEINSETSTTTTKSNNLKCSVYKEFCQGVEKKVDLCLYDDLNECHISDNGLMMWIVPDLYKDFKQQTVNNIQILKVIISTIDARQLQDLVCRILQGRLVMFKGDSLQPVLKASLSWESIEQYFLWQLLLAHDFSLDSFLPLLPHLDVTKHSEALTTIMLLLKQEKPTADLVKYLFSRDIRNNGGDIFVFSTLKHWCRDNMDKVGDLISTLLSTRYPTSPNKRKRSGNKNINSTVPSADQVLGHLDQIRLLSEKDDNLGLYNLDSLQRALQQAHSNSSESQKKQFSLLFALAEEEEETVPSNKRGGGRGRKTSGKGNVKKPSTRDVSESSDESSEEEEIVKPKQAKKRKKVVSDSD